MNMKRMMVWADQNGYDVRAWLPEMVLRVVDENTFEELRDRPAYDMWPELEGAPAWYVLLGFNVAALPQVPLMVAYGLGKLAGRIQQWASNAAARLHDTFEYGRTIGKSRFE